jgi:hypothetical protein
MDRCDHGITTCATEPVVVSGQLQGRHWLRDACLAVVLAVAVLLAVTVFAVHAPRAISGAALLIKNDAHPEIAVTSLVTDDFEQIILELLGTDNNALSARSHSLGRCWRFTKKSASRNLAFRKRCAHQDVLCISRAAFRERRTYLRLRLSISRS